MVKQNNAKLTEIEKAARDALQDTAKDVLKLAKQKAPKKKGDLRRSGRVLVDDVTVRVVFRDPAAWLQHERLDYRHDDGEAKYLEHAVDEVGVEADITSGVIARLR
ncbi:HK97 gp10 family phage protein [Cellulomonas sp. ES6]|uniref:HK97 gp10 family phage protein n=1 Tax=Cellulomonas sp. ES6 TaxID=3039384 RepID=UPI0024B79111|nr:HK97 gp10 family phage protein [Cellulomonas sp. ES6]WHP18835.1 HK97 gp10 family phage protein [Cellulomonas sp. ES6]